MSINDNCLFILCISYVKNHGQKNEIKSANVTHVNLKQKKVKGKEV